jgi:hypothetical protein
VTLEHVQAELLRAFFRDSPVYRGLKTRKKEGGHGPSMTGGTYGKFLDGKLTWFI